MARCCIGRNRALIIVWCTATVILVAAPFLARCFGVPRPESSCAAECGHAIAALWALGGGVLGALLNLGLLRMATRLPENRVIRGLAIEPAIGAGVALIAYLTLLTRQVSIFPVGSFDGEPTFERVLLVGILSGFLWEPFLTRVQALAAKERLDELENKSQQGPPPP